MATLTESTPQGESSGSGPGRQDTMGVLKLRLDNVPPTPHDSPLLGGYTPGSDEGKNLTNEDASKQGRNNEKTEELNLTNEADTEVIVEDKGSGENGDSATDQVSTARLDQRRLVTAIGLEVVFAANSVPVKMRSEKAKEKEIAKEKGVAFRNVEEAPRLIRSITTLQPLPSIDPKDKAPTGITKKQYTIEEIAYFFHG
ncbi:hypothetical protein Tco_1507560 [Tanacetum coccineum]